MKMIIKIILKLSKETLDTYSRCSYERIMETGWMHNRARMIIASLTKHLVNSLAVGS